MRYVLFSILLAGTSAYATPLYYTFDGSVTGVNVDDMHVSVGDKAEYKFLVDQDKEGYYSPEGVFTPIAGTYYVDYLGGGPYYALSSEHTYSWDFGNFEPSTKRATIQGSMGLSNTLSFIEVFAYNGPDWAVGNTYSGRQYSTGVNSDYREILSTLTLTNISTSPETVPEPSSIILAAFGIVSILISLLNKSNKRPTLCS